MDYVTLVREFLEDAEWSSVNETSILLFNSLCGYGIVVLPFACKQIGIITGLLAFAILVAVFEYTTRTLLAVSDERKATSYAASMEKAYGIRGFLITAVAQLVLCLVSMAYILQIVSDVAPPVVSFGTDELYSNEPLDSASHEDDDHVEQFESETATPPSKAQQFTSVLIATAIVFPFCLNYQLRPLRQLSFVTITCLIPICFLVFIRAFWGRPTDDLGDGYEEGWYTPKSAHRVFKSLGLLCFAATAQHQTFAVYTCLRRRSFRRFSAAAWRAAVLVYLVFAYITILGYITFGRYLLPTIFSGYDVNEVAEAESDSDTDRRLSSSADDDWAWTNYLLRILVSIVVMTSFPANMLVARQSACQIGQRIEEMCRPTRGESIDATAGMSLSAAYDATWATEKAEISSQGFSEMAYFQDSTGTGTNLNIIADSLENASRKRHVKMQKQNGDTRFVGLPHDSEFISSENDHDLETKDPAADGIVLPQREGQPPFQKPGGTASGDFESKREQSEMGEPKNSYSDSSISSSKMLREPFVNGKNSSGGILAKGISSFSSKPMPQIGMETGLGFQDWADIMQQDLQNDPEFERLSHGNSTALESSQAAENSSLCSQMYYYAFQTCASIWNEVLDFQRHKMHILITITLHVLVVILVLFTLASDLEFIGSIASVTLSLILPACLYLRSGLVSDYGAVAILGLIPNQIGMGMVLVLGVILSIIFLYVHIYLWSEGS